MRILKSALCASVAVLAMGAAQGALADPTAAPSAAPAAAPAAPAAPAANPMATPAMGATLSANPDPLNFTLGPVGKIYVTGALTALGMTQNNVNPGDHATWGDISNAQIFIQKTDGLVQFFVEVGDYSLPALGTTYVQSNNLVTDTFGVVPVAYLKIAPTSSFNIEAGKLPTLVGAEGILHVPEQQYRARPSMEPGTGGQSGRAGQLQPRSDQPLALLERRLLLPARELALRPRGLHHHAA